MWSILKIIFFRFDPERAHYLSMNLFRLGIKIPILSYFLKKSFSFEDASLEKNICGLHFKNPIGLAAGFDKDGRWLDLLSILGFGFIEVGTVTPLPQTGNAKPRLFRLVKDKSVINRMGFNNLGVDALIEKLKRFKNKNGIIIGGNIGKNKDSKNAIEDYLICFKKLFPYVDYFVINVSSPNTANLRSLQDKGPLDHLLSSIQSENFKNKYPKPVFLKIAPDLSETAIADVLEVLINNKMAGIIANNTTISRPESILDTQYKNENGGLSGEILREMSEHILKIIKDKQYPQAIISVGGIMNSEDAKKRLISGADLIQIYSSMIYEGPWLCKKMKKALAMPN